MKAKLNGLELEGTPEEIAQYIGLTERKQPFKEMPPIFIVAPPGSS